MERCYNVEVIDNMAVIEADIRLHVENFIMFSVFQLTLIWFLSILIWYYQGQTFLFIFAIFRMVEFIGSMVEFRNLLSATKEIVTLKRLSRNTLLLQVYIALFKVLITVNKA